MPDPDIIALQTELARVEALAQREPGLHADGPQWRTEKQEIDAARSRAYVLRRQLADAEQRGTRERQRIGLARRQLGIPDESHEARVYRVTGGRARSTADCTAAERRMLLEEYKALGFKVKPPARAGRAPSAQTMDRATMLTRVHQLLAEQELPWAYAEAIVRRQRGITDKGISCPVDCCDDTELRGLIAALWRREQRQTAREAPHA